MSPDTEPDETPAPKPGEVHLCHLREPMAVREAMTLDYREVPPVYVCPKRATERGHDTWADDMASGPSPAA